MDEKDDEIWYRITFKGKLALLLIDIKDFFCKGVRAMPDWKTKITIITITLLAIACICNAIAIMRLFQ